MIEYMFLVFLEMKSLLIIVATIVVVETAFFKKKEEPCEDHEKYKLFCWREVQKGYCTSPFASEKEKLERCPKSCGLCCDDKNCEVHKRKVL
ncbi:hypothetical protein GCK32_001138 [Trichostrongylus colubriformis]|uniref:ShKT domain-containing protein n=1 Tax=Trichostrongylus colubriformis TaxID=6319 RepID=A0AAN8IU19_TRICO